MANLWTNDQLKAINTDGRNILVSAAAGSGKTAVLVERIIRKITSADLNVDIDRLVVVTFTKAAAAEMKQRIRQSVDRLLEQDPSDEKLQRQLALIDNAPITTIDSFCLNIVRNYFADIDIDPGFKIADEGEIKLIENDVMQEMLEDYYASHDDRFYDFVEAYGTGRNDSAIEDIILKLYRYARSYPWPDEWFDESLSAYNIKDEGGLERLQAVKYLKNYIIYRLKDFDKKYETAQQVCESPMGPLKYLTSIKEDHASIKQILAADKIEKIGQLINAVTFSNIGRVSAKDTDEDKKEFVKSIRDEYKNFIKKEMQENIFSRDISLLISDIEKTSHAVEMMVKLAKDFSARMQAEKRSRNIIDFNDMEHMALNVLVKRVDGKIVYTEASDALSDYYSEIFIDEYQDSNMLQEVILTAVSKGKYDETENNIYMVGDVKQSIYKFRMACPQLFMDKYNSYSMDVNSTCLKILLQVNYRSRINVLESANDVFNKAMTEEFSGISYDDGARLNLGFDYPENELQLDTDTDIYVAEQSDSSDMARDSEGKLIAGIIKQLHDKKADGTYNMVYDKNCKNGYRRIRYSDIVVITRSVKGWSDTFVNALMNEDIPAYSDASEGYFNVREVKLVLNYLAVIDNPLQDIPMAAVMLSYFGGFDTDELAAIRNVDKDVFLFDTLRSIIISEEESEPKSENESNPVDNSVSLKQISGKLKEKIRRFVENIDRLRQMKETLSVNDLLWEILYNTGYYDYAGTMPAGSRRQANLDILLSRAAAFEKTSYSGLFNFLRYIERLKKFDIDFAEASLLGENDDLIRVMSIHKSKGLEFPVVILAGMGKKFNQQDSTGPVIIDSDLGIGTNLIDVELRTKRTTLIKQAISKKIVQENISEELRVLYVAMTRAREKLIMTGTVSNIDNSVDKWNKTTEILKQEDTYSYADILGFSNYFDIVMPVAGMPQEQRKGHFKVKYIADTDNGMNTDEYNGADTDNSINTDKYNVADADTGMDAEEYTNAGTGRHNDMQTGHNTTSEAVKTVELPEYPYETGRQHKVKITVSELKKMQQDADFDSQDMSIEAVLCEKAENENSGEDEVYVPQFISGKQTELAGSDRGTAYHRVMECLDYNRVDSMQHIKECIEQMVADEKLTDRQAECINTDDIYAFVESDTGMRVKKAFLAGNVRREQPFVFGTDQQDTNDMLLVQGIIDLYFEENDRLVIVDYKTDRVSKNKYGEEELVKRYAVQLDYYAKALQQLTGKEVSEKVIYSFTLGKAIRV